MHSVHLCRNRLAAFAVLGALFVVGQPASAQTSANSNAQDASHACPHDDSGLKLPDGFCATVFADDIGHARHMVAAPSGVLYVNTWSGRYYGNDTPHAGGFLVALQDKSGTGKADVIQRFGETVQSGGAGGTGIGMYKGSIYAENNDRILRYSLPAGSIVPSGSAETVVSGLPLGGDHLQLHHPSQSGLGEYRTGTRQDRGVPVAGVVGVGYLRRNLYRVCQCRSLVKCSRTGPWPVDRDAVH